MDVEILTYEADPDRGGFGTRVHSLIRMFAAFARVHVTMTDWFGGPRVPGVAYTALPVRDTPLTRLRRLRTYYKTDFPPRPAADPADLTVVETLDLWELAGQRADVPRVLDEHNVYWELLKYDLASAPFFSTWAGRRASVRRLLGPRLLRRAKDFEIAVIRRAEGTLVTSEADRGRVLEEAPDAADRVHVLPNTVDLDRFPDFSSGETADEAVFVGNYAYGPNREAARFVLDRLAPSLPRARFRLVGGNAAGKAGVSRAEMDAWALRSHQNAVRAIDEGRVRRALRALRDDVRRSDPMSAIFVKIPPQMRSAAAPSDSPMAKPIKHGPA